MSPVTPSLADRDGKIWMDGQMVEWRDAKIHVLSHTLHYGCGAFEGVRAYKTDDGSTAIFRLEEHTERLFNSAKILRMKIPFSKEEVNEAQKAVIRENKLESGYLRPLTWIGDKKLGVSPKGNTIHLMVAAWPWGAYLGEGNLHAQNLGAVEQALGVFFQAKNSGSAHALVGTHTLKGAAAVVQGMAEHVDLGVAPIDHLAIHPDFSITVGHGGRKYAHGLGSLIGCAVQYRKPPILRGRTRDGQNHWRRLRLYVLRDQLRSSRAPRSSPLRPGPPREWSCPQSAFWARWPWVPRPC